MMTESKPPRASLTRPCLKCRAQEATLDSRGQPVCADCFTKFIATKCIKQIGILGKETRPAPSTTGGPPTGIRRYLLGLSMGVSSTVLLHLLNENVEFQLAKGRNAPFELVVVHIDPSSPDQHPSSTAHTAAEAALNRYRARYQRFTFHCVPLLSALTTDQDSDPALNLPTLLSHPTATSPPPPTTATTTPQNPELKATTAASRTDIQTHLTRRALLAQASAHNCQALLLGHSTTALAELTLAEAAKGRGFALPWLVQDGFSPAPRTESGTAAASAAGSVVGFEGGVGAGSGGDAVGGRSDSTENKENAVEGGKSVLVYHPLRDALRKELVIYAGLVDPPLTNLIHQTRGDSRGNGAVVSHKDLSIEEVMTRYFAEVEESYPSVVANVARTTGKLVRAGEQTNSQRCGLCGMPLDEDGDERWRGELGIQNGPGAATTPGRRLCYGCERSTDE